MHFRHNGCSLLGGAVKGRPPFAALLWFGCAVAIAVVPRARVDARPARSGSLSLKAQTKRLSVLDYYYLLPSLGTGASSTRREKRETIQPRYHPVIDAANDYMRFHPDSSPTEQLAVFRARGKADLIADSLPDFETDYNYFALYELRNGKMRDVTRQMLPIPARTNEFLYELPRFGTTIRVFRFSFEKRSRHHVFDLQWRGGRLVKVP